MDFDKLRKLLNEKEAHQEELQKLANDIEYTEQNLKTMKDSQKKLKARDAALAKEITDLMKEG